MNIREFLQALDTLFPKYGFSEADISALVHESKTGHYKINCTYGKFSIKEKPYYLDDHEWQYALNCQHRLWKSGADVPEILLTVTGQRCFQIGSGLYRIARWSEGYTPSRDRACELGSSLAKLHTIASSIECVIEPTFNIPYSRCRSSPQTINQWKGLLSRIFLGEGATASDLPTKCRSLSCRTLELAASLQDIVLPAGMVHGDAHYRNLLIDDQQGVTWIDLDDVRYDYFLADVCWFINILAYDWPSIGSEMRIGPDFGIEPARKFLRSYEGIRPLSGSETQNLPSFLELAAVAAYHNCVDRNAVRSNKVRFEQEIERLQYQMRTYASIWET